MRKRAVLAWNTHAPAVSFLYILGEPSHWLFFMRGDNSLGRGARLPGGSIRYNSKTELIRIDEHRICAKER